MKAEIRRTSVLALATAVLTAIAAATTLTSPAAPVPSPAQVVDTAVPQEREELRQAMRELLAVGNAGVQVRVHDERGDWTDSAGVSELGGNAPVPTDGRFRIGSVTKTFVATVVLQLVAEGRLGLDDPVARYLPEFGVDPRITVRMLLQHTSGIFNYTGEQNPDGTVDAIAPLTGKEFVDSRFRTYRPEELVRFALARPLRFEPGTAWAYSNTNYVLLGLLVEKLTGTPYADQVELRILDPLQLWDTHVPGTWAGIPGPHAHGYLTYRHEGRLEVVDVTRLNPSSAGAAGEMISTTRDVDTFLAALMGGKLLPPALMEEMRRTVPVSSSQSPGQNYGLGVAQLELGPECGGSVWGHTGGIPGYHTFAFSTPDGSRRLVMSTTWGEMDLEDPAVLQRLNAALEKIAAAAFCDRNPS